MRHLFYFASVATYIALFQNILTGAASSTNRLMIEAGCKKKGRNGDWIRSGKLLEKGACIDEDYRRYVVPEKGITKVYCTIEDEKVRAVDAKEGTVSIDFTLTMRWLDPNIKTNFTSEDKKNGGVILNKGSIKLIWRPDLYIFNSSSIKSIYEWNKIKSLAIFTTKEFNQVDATNNKGKQISNTAVKWTLEVKSAVYCNFNHSAYPMDKQLCNLRFGSSDFGTIFVLYDPNNIYHGNAIYKAADFDMSITFFDEQLNNGNNTVGINIKMSRIVNSFLLKYYVPCIGIVLVSEISFVIPVTAIPGRVALLVTQFLTLTNLFIHQMVSKNT